MQIILVTVHRVAFVSDIKKKDFNDFVGPWSSNVIVSF